MSREEITTILICLACDGTRELRLEDGSGFYRIVACSWCTDGGMDRTQVLAWTKHERERRERMVAEPDPEQK